MRKQKSGGGGRVPTLTKAQIRALKFRQLAAFMADAVHGPGSTLAALRRRGLIIGRQPHARLTPLGERVARRIQRQENAHG
jgi:hypothetical protein